MTDVPLFRTRSHTVLVVEDDSANRELLAGLLTREQYTVRTAADGERICQPLGLSRSFASIVRHHHERWDGFGYPDGIGGEAIPQGARIVGLVDAFDAMTHDRPYRGALGLDVAMDEIRSGSGRQFDPGLASVFLEFLEGAPVRPN